MAENPNIEVLMSTYNGEKYLSEQLDSILAQKGCFNLKITVRDDGSSDGTHDILNYYVKEHGISVIYGKNIGVNASMMELVKQSGKDCDYFTFSDQDDVWYDFRLYEAVNSLNALNSTVPLLWSCMEELTDEKLKPFGLMPYPKKLGNFYNAMIQNKTAGHTQVFNQELRNLIVDYPAEKMYVYDWAIYLMASAFGEVRFCENSCGKYRQHGANAIGYELGWLRQTVRRIKRMTRGQFRNNSVQLEFFYGQFKDKLCEDYRSEAERFLNSRKNIIKRVRFAFTTKIKRNTKVESLQFWALYILGVFN